MEYQLLESKILDFFSFAKKRHAIYVRRFERNKPHPWTKDPILSTYKFTNVYRELDTGTIYCRQAIREPFANNKELFFNIAAYRRYNFIPTHKALGYIEEYDPELYVEIMATRAAKGEQIFTGAHMLCGNIRDDTGYMPPTKVEQIFGISFNKLWEHRREIEPKPGIDNLESSFHKLLSANIPGYGDFIGYEVITDLRWTKYLSGADDIMTWANPGPGAKRGMQHLMGLQTSNQTGKVAPREVRVQYPSREGYIQIMRFLLSISKDLLPEWMPAWEMREVEHTLCEWDKYERVRLGQGKPRSRFVPPHLR